jgi:hypothetical protein
MTRRNIVAAVLFILALASGVEAKKQTGGRRTSEKQPYCAVRSITDCADEGCGPHSDPELNKRKNVRSDNQQSVGRTIAWMKALPDPTNFTEDNKDRTELRQLGEGQKITVVAWLLEIREEHQETCNCGLDTLADTDNHLVLVDPGVRNPTLKRFEPHSITAEFTPRVRLDHPRFAREIVRPLLLAKAPGAKKGSASKLMVRVTGLLMFDSHHFLMTPLNRENNWEVHPILKFEYCPKNMVCRGNNDANWRDIERN